MRKFEIGQSARAADTVAVALWGLARALGIAVPALPRPFCRRVRSRLVDAGAGQYNSHLLRVRAREIQWLSFGGVCVIIVRSVRRAVRTRRCGNLRARARGKVEGIAALSSRYSPAVSTWAKFAATCRQRRKNRLACFRSAPCKRVRSARWRSCRAPRWHRTPWPWRSSSLRGIRMPWRCAGRSIRWRMISMHPSA